MVGPAHNPARHDLEHRNGANRCGFAALAFQGVEQFSDDEVVLNDQSANTDLDRDIGPKEAVQKPEQGVATLEGACHIELHLYVAAEQRLQLSGVAGIECLRQCMDELA